RHRRLPSAARETGRGAGARPAEGFRDEARDLGHHARGPSEQPALPRHLRCPGRGPGALRRVTGLPQAERDRDRVLAGLYRADIQAARAATLADSERRRRIKPSSASDRCPRQTRWVRFLETVFGSGCWLTFPVACSSTSTDLGTTAKPVPAATQAM